MTVTFGWDASDYNHGHGPMDMGAAARDGIQFYTHKGTEGTSTRHNPKISMATARDAGIPLLGCYLVPRSGPSVSAQVDFFLSWMDQQCPWWPDFPGWFWQIDTEKWSYDQVSAQRGHDVAVELARRTGRVCLHYAPEWAYGNGVPQDEVLWASSYVAGSGWYHDLYSKVQPSQWHAYSGRAPRVLQYTSSATIGTQPLCDANAFQGTVDDFRTMIGVGMTTPANPTNAQIYALLAGIVDGLAVPGPGVTSAVPDWVTKGAKDQTVLDATTRVLNLLSTVEANLLAAIGQVGAPSDAQIAAQAQAIADALIASGANELTTNDHASIVADVQAALNTLHAG